MHYLVDIHFNIIGIYTNEEWGKIHDAGFLFIYFSSVFLLTRPMCIKYGKITDI